MANGRELLMANRAAAMGSGKDQNVYDWVRYTGSNTTKFLDLEANVPSLDSNIAIVCQYNLDYTSGNFSFFCRYWGSWSEDYALSHKITWGDVKTYCAGSNVQQVSGFSTGQLMTVKVDYGTTTAVLNGNVLKNEGVRTPPLNDVRFKTYPIYVGGNSSQTPNNCRFRYIKVFVDGDLAYSYVPYYQNAAGFMDIVNGRFYTADDLEVGND